MRKGIIYKATSPSGKKYYGRTIQKLSKRKYGHNAAARNGSNLYFHNAIRKYGEENILWEVVETHKHKDKEELIKILNELEIKYIDDNNTLYPNGYNLNKGGGSYTIGLSPRTGKTYEELYGEEKAKEIREKQSKNNSHYWKGKKQEKKSIEKRVKANTGKNRTEDVKEKTRQTMLGVKHTEERRKNISNSLKGKSELAKNFGGPRYGKDNPNYIEISKELEEKIVYLHKNEFRSPKNIAKIVGINGQKIINLLREKQDYIEYSKLCKMKKKFEYESKSN